MFVSETGLYRQLLWEVDFWYQYLQFIFRYFTNIYTFYFLHLQAFSHFLAMTHNKRSSLQSYHAAGRLDEASTLHYSPSLCERKNKTSKLQKY